MRKPPNLFVVYWWIWSIFWVNNFFQLGSAQRRRPSPNHVDGIRFIQQTDSSVTLKWNYRVWQKSYQFIVKPETENIIQELSDNRQASVTFKNLKNANNYWITIQARKPDGSWSKKTTVKLFTAPSPPQNVKIIGFDETGVMVSFENPNAHRETAMAFARLNKSPSTIQAQPVDQVLNQVHVTNIPAGSSYDMTMFYVFNERRSDSVVIRVTKPPHAIEQLSVDKIKIQDYGLASLDLSWRWPSEGFWGSVKITINPPLDPEYNSEIWITDRKIPVKL